MDDPLEANMPPFDPLHGMLHAQSTNPQSTISQSESTPVENRSLPGVGLASVEPVGDRRAFVSAGGRDDQNRKFRRRDYGVTYWGDSMDDIAGRMTQQYRHIVAYAIWQRERCPTTGNLHWQCYVEFFTPQYMSFLKDEIFNDQTIHVEPRTLSRIQAREYCKKNKTRLPGSQNEVGPFECGTWREQGNKESKMTQIQEAIIDGRPLMQLAEEDPATVLRNRTHFEWYENQLKSDKSKSTKRKITVRLFVGPTGTGKTHLAMEEAKQYTKGVLGDVYFLSYQSRKQNPGTIWWDGYKFNKAVIMDDYHNWFPVATLLRVLDEYPLRLEIKGSTMWASFTELWITSNKFLDEWTDYDGLPIDHVHREALERRIHWILHIPERGKYEVLKQPHPPFDMRYPTVPKEDIIQTEAQDEVPRVTAEETIAEAPPQKEEPRLQLEEEYK